MEWEALEDQEKFRNVAPDTLLMYDDQRALIVDARREGTFDVTLRVYERGKARWIHKVAQTDRVGTVARHLVGPAARVVSMPPVVWRRSRFKLLGIAVAVLVPVLSALTILIFDIGFDSLSWVLPAVIAAAVVAGFGLVQSKPKPTILAPAYLGLTEENVLDFALAHEHGQLWIPPQGGDRRVLAERRVAHIRDEYLRLRSDIVYRIECSALFDPAVPTTAEFEASLVAYDDGQSHVAVDRLDALATDVEIAFNVAKQHAERRSLEHLPPGARDEGRRAAKAARLAADAGSEGERKAALTQVRRILDSLALYYLPQLDDELRAIEAPRERGTS